MIFKKMFKILIFFIFINFLVSFNASANAGFSLWVQDFKIKAIDLELEINYDKTVADANFFNTYQAKKAKLEELMSQWESLTESIEQHN